MFFNTKIKKVQEGKQVVLANLIQAETFTEAEMQAALIFGEDSNFLGIDNVIKYNIIRAYLNDDCDYPYYEIKLQFDFLDVKLVKEMYLVQAKNFKDALEFILSTISSNEVSFASVIAQKVVEFEDVYTYEVLIDMGFKEKSLELIEEDPIMTVLDL
jgi:hypothetical protein